ncbi:dihydroceramidase [Blastomyces parvus]|uniref:Dihydroceramidase n=1 Tax=Blastomyces parvus TaxID=2060905 RepID=A0A2B7WPX5_9EURO|nr:dihydroceramidase [Blastomyces parvus]
MFNCLVPGLVDDLSMLLGAGIMFHHVVTINSGRRVKVLTFMALTVTLTAAAWAHIRLGDSALHQVVFGTMVITVGYRSVKLLARLISDQRMRSKLRRLLRIGNVTLLAAYGLWLVDVFACPSLRSIRHAIGLPLAWIFELHGWWHVLTAIGVYIAMIVGEFLHEGNRTQALGPKDGYLDILRGPSLQGKRKGERLQALKTD